MGATILVESTFENRMISQKDDDRLRSKGR
jgi:hypothetical protein